jgi:hypothetical protein
MIYLSYILPGNLDGAPPSSIYENAVKRFAESYTIFLPNIDHRLILVNSNGGFNQNIANIFEKISFDLLNYNGSGWDIGGHQHVINSLQQDDWILCFSTWTYFKMPGWLESFDNAKNKYGDCIYGAMSSKERYFHLRGTGLFMRCGTAQKYPLIANNKEQSWNFESSKNSITNWYINNNQSAYVITPNEIVILANSRKLKNTYRSGNQSNLWIYDKHTNIYENAKGFSKIKLELLANSKLINLLLNIYLLLKFKN